MRPLLLSLLLLLPLPAAAQDTRTFQPPAGCTAYLTVQGRECSVTHHFRCEADPAGWQRRVDMDEEGIAYVGAIDAEAQWMESIHVLSSYEERLAPGASDPASFSELTATGADNFDFTMLSDRIGATRLVGGDSLTGRVIEIDGIALEQTRTEIRALAPDGSEIWRSGGNEYISREWRMFLSGPITTTVGTETWESDNSPVEFIFPGEPGFLSASPKHGCGEVLSSAPIPRSPREEISHDDL